MSVLSEREPSKGCEEGIPVSGAGIYSVVHELRGAWDSGPSSGVLSSCFIPGEMVLWFGSLNGARSALFAVSVSSYLEYQGPFTDCSYRVASTELSHHGIKI